MQAQAGQRVLHFLQAVGITVQRQQVQIGQLQQVGGFAARCGTGVQHPGTRWQWQQQGRCTLGRHILHRHVTVGKARQLVYRTRLVQHHGLGQLRVVQRAGGQPHRCQALHIGRRAAAPGIDPQHHRRAPVGRRQQGRPMRRPIALQTLDPPGRVVVQRHRLALYRADQGGPLAQKAPQHRVDKIGRCGSAGVGCSAGFSAAGSAGCGYGLVDQGVLGIRRWPIARPQQSQRADQQRGHGWWGRLGRQQRQRRLGCAQVAQDQEGQRLGTGAQRRRHRRQQITERAAGTHRSHGVGSVAEQAVQRRGRGGWRRQGCRQRRAVNRH